MQTELELNLQDVPIASAPATARAAEREVSRLEDFYELTKPRMNLLVVLTTTVGFYMASVGAIHWLLLLHTVIGTALTAAGAAVLNQLVERDFDKLMPRTKNRPLPAGRVLPGEALLYGVAMGVTGIAYHFLFVNQLTALLGATTLLSYLFIYTPMKRWTSLNTIIGAVPGAIPPMMGVTAVTGVLSMQALSLFGILFFWQMPHFLAIAILYRQDYAAGGFKMLPVVDEDLSCTGHQIVLYALALVPVSLMPTMVNMAGVIYFGAALLLGIMFLSYGVSCAVRKTRVDARKLFFASIIYLPLLLLVLMLDRV
jgi:protoheme IX farnesyltransferase